MRPLGKPFLCYKIDISDDGTTRILRVTRSLLENENSLKNNQNYIKLNWK